ncbi:hypothetical protein [Streptomyces sp. ME19-01-6]|uniref:hypothetical protein n=1 Tax=Streptomyces sp. ME19-01-6 TaxID=3028686 RepID=UPI0029B9CC94|nr:hypothetical protein [Streptomyces sp. ME19-01-6]MDX3224595.1 hypothetical protein [Streptomyces sp. ME19-01-6]
MTDEHDLVRPRATPARRPRRPSFVQAKTASAAYPIDDLAPYLEPPWTKEDTDTPDRSAIYTHPEGHHIGLRLQPGDLIIQTWITAGPDLPPLPIGTAEEKAEAQAANDARLQPGRSWHRTIPTRHAEDLTTAVSSLLHDQLIPALTKKPRFARTVSYATKAQPNAQDEAPRTKKGRSTAKNPPSAKAGTAPKNKETEE